MSRSQQQTLPVIVCIVASMHLGIEVCNYSCNSYDAFNSIQKVAVEFRQNRLKLLFFFKL